MNIIIKDVEGKQRIQRLIDFLDLNFYDWSGQPNDGKPIVSGSLPPARCTTCGSILEDDECKRCTDTWNDLGNTLYEMGNEEPAW